MLLYKDLHVHIEKKIISQCNSLETIQFLFKVFYNIMKNKRDIPNKKRYETIFLNSLKWKVYIERYRSQKKKKYNNLKKW